MLRLLKKTWWIILLAAGTQSAPGFALLGNREPYHISALGYSGDFSDQPKNLDQGFRWTIPKLYYTYDASFLNYFGTNGVASVDAGIQIINDLPNVSSITNLDDYPLYSMRANFTAQALRLFDIKSAALEMMVERLGLADPQAFTWTLRQRALPPGASCPFFQYGVIQRNFDPDSLSPSSYVNGSQFTYIIDEFCPTPDQAIATEQRVDPNALYRSAVASGKIIFGNETYWGYYYTGLTRDDVGGLRHLYHPDNRYVSATGPNTYTFATNYSTSQLLVTSNMNLLAWQALTNNAAGLQALYPDLVILRTTNTFTNIFLTNYTAYFTNLPWDPVGSNPRIAFQTNVELVVLPTWTHTFGNLYTMSNSAGRFEAVPVYSIESFTNKQFVTLQTTTVTNDPWMPFGIVKTNTRTRTYLTNMVAGEFFILPTNACSVNVLGLQATIANRWTNVLISLTNAVADTNNAGFTNLLLYTEEMVGWWTNRAYVINPVTCDTNSVATLQGIDKVSFLRRDFDSLLNRFFYPITNIYFLNAVTNWSLERRTVQRFVTVPDILFDADDLASGPTSWPLVSFTVGREVPHFVTASDGAGTNLYGPGTIEPTVSFTFNKVGTLYYNDGPFFIDERTAVKDYTWASFDGTTNPPIIYPTNFTLAGLTNQVFMYIANHTVPNARAGQAYSVQLMAGGSGGRAPYTWNTSPNSPALPLGFELTTNGLLHVTVPEIMQPNIYDFTVRMQDATSRYVDRAFTLTILP